MVGLQRMLPKRDVIANSLEYKQLTVKTMTVALLLVESKTLTPKQALLTVKRPKLEHKAYLEAYAPWVKASSE